MSGVQKLAGTVLKGYQLEDRLGATSHSAVYRASGRADGRSAVKVVDSQVESPAALMERLRQAASALSEAAHPGIVPIHEVGLSGRLTFAAAPFVPGRTLEDLMEEGGLDNERAWLIVTRVANALDTVHGQGLVYRSLKPVNVLVDEAYNVHLAEFGMTGRRVGPLAKRSSSYRLATPQYLAPEQVEGKEPEAQADVYALAVLLFELLTGAPLAAPRPTTRQILQATLSGPPPSARARLPNLPRGLDAVLARAMAREPEARPRSASELLEQILALPDEEGLAGSSFAAFAAAPVASMGVCVPKAPIPDESMVVLLRRMGVPIYAAQRRRILTSYFGALMHCARDAAGPRWPDVLAASGLQDFSEGEEPPDDDARGVPVEDASRLAGGFDTVFGLDSLDVQRAWGRLVTELWIRKNRLPLRMRARPEQRVEDVLYILSRSMDRIRGERLTAWMRVDKTQFWLVHYDNLMAVGRRRSTRSCYFWTAAIEAALRWGRLTNDWLVEETECGCVTGTYNCVFKIECAVL